VTLAAMPQQLGEEAEVLSWCIQGLEPWARGEPVIVNLRVPCDPRSTCVVFDHARVLCVLHRMAVK
jgi:hypothetical protein